MHATAAASARVRYREGTSIRHAASHAQGDLTARYLRIYATKRLAAPVETPADQTRHLTDDDIVMFDLALFASGKVIYEIK